MAINDLILLDKIIDDKFNESVKKISMGEFFENFCNEQILKNYDLSLEEIEDGITDGSNDGGIDAIYIFANGGLLKDSDDLEYLKKESSLEIVIITSKHDNSFEQAVINSEYTTISEFFNFRSGGMSIIGAIIGLPLAKLELGYVMSIIDMEITMFGNDIELLSYVYGFVITMVFAVLVALFMRKSLKKVQMVESLKSVE